MQYIVLYVESNEPLTWYRSAQPQAIISNQLWKMEMDSTIFSSAFSTSVALLVVHVDVDLHVVDILLPGHHRPLDSRHQGEETRGVHKSEVLNQYDEKKIKIPGSHTEYRLVLPGLLRRWPRWLCMALTIWPQWLQQLPWKVSLRKCFLWAPTWGGRLASTLFSCTGCRWSWSGSCELSASSVSNFIYSHKRKERGLLFFYFAVTTTHQMFLSWLLLFFFCFFFFFFCDLHGFIVTAKVTLLGWMFVEHCVIWNEVSSVKPFCMAS